MGVNSITIFDVETGGLEHNTHPITQIALLNVEASNFNVNFEYDKFVKPYADLVITPKALEKSMVSMKQINDGLTSKEVVKELIVKFKEADRSSGKIKKKTILVGHNIQEFDMAFLELLFLVEGKDLYDYVSRQTVDTLVLAKQVWPDESKHNLTICCERIKYKLTGAHSAMNDVRANYELYKYFIKKMKNKNSEKNSSEVKELLEDHRKHFTF